MRDKFRETFREEARELLGQLEDALLELEKTPDDMEQIGRVFRIMHTIKGSGAMFGYDGIASFTHDIETAYDLVRNGILQVTTHLVDQTLAACDQIKRMIEVSEGSSDIDVTVTESLTASFKQMLKKGDGRGLAGDASPGNPPTSATKTVGLNVTYRVRFQPEPDIFATGTNPLLLIDELLGLGHGRVFATTVTVPPLDIMDPETCYTHWDILLTTKKGIDAIKDVFIFVEDECRLSIDTIDDEEVIDEEADYKKLGEILVERGDLKREDVGRVLASRKKLGQLLVESGLVDVGTVQSALAEQEHVRNVRGAKQASETAASIRVPAAKLDMLVNLVGELVTVQSRLSQLASSSNSLEIVQIAEIVERLTADLRDNTMSIRMLPIGTTFNRFQRLVRDLSTELGKEIVLTVEGAETELDKTVIERLNDPLVHLIRNSIDHGIEPPDQRQNLGKPRRGTVHLSAAHSGAHVLIQVKDDGAGLDKERIFQKAVEKGLVAPDANLTDREILYMIFAAGFSTAKSVTGVSGRGVGMDVVKKNVDALQGSIDVASEPGIGTTITLKLPLTLAIIDGLLVRIDDAFFVLPLSAIDECVELTREDAAKGHGQNLATIRGEIVPYIRLRQQFGMDGTPPLIEQIVTTQVDHYRVGLVVDEVIGEHQTVIKSLGRAYSGVQEVSGATILGDGKVALILDLPKLIQKAELDEKRIRAEKGSK